MRNTLKVGLTGILALGLWCVQPLPCLAEEPGDSGQVQLDSPAVIAYRARIAPDVDAAVRLAFAQCLRREMYSRRAMSAMVLTIAADGSITNVSVKVVNRMGTCAAKALAGVRFAPPPVAPLRYAVGAPVIGG